MSMDLETLLYTPPTLRHRANDGSVRTEVQALVGYVTAPLEARALLEAHDICLDHAQYDPQSGHWTPCLFSDEVANLLTELSLVGPLPFAFEAVPSSAWLAIVEAQARRTPQPILPLKAWVTPASLETLSRAVSEGWIQSAWRRRSAPGNVDGTESNR